MVRDENGEADGGVERAWVQGGIPAEKEGILKVSRSNLIV